MCTNVCMYKLCFVSSEVLAIRLYQLPITHRCLHTRACTHIRSFGGCSRRCGTIRASHVTHTHSVYPTCIWCRWCQCTHFHSDAFVDYDPFHCTVNSFSWPHTSLTVTARIKSTELYSFMYRSDPVKARRGATFSLKKHIYE